MTRFYSKQFFIDRRVRAALILEVTSGGVTDELKISSVKEKNQENLINNQISSKPLLIFVFLATSGGTSSSRRFSSLFMSGFSIRLTFLAGVFNLEI